MNYNFDILNDILKSSGNQIYELFNGFGQYITGIKAINKNYGIGDNYKFNIFSSISDTYRKENLHSDILRLILDPETDTIGNSKNMELFTDVLNKIKPELKIKIGNNVSLEREKARIDVLIFDTEKNSIIIENKIKSARDRDDQLGRYYNSVKNRGLNVKGIVYLTLTPEKQLDIDTSIKDPKLRESIKDLIIPLSVLNKNDGINFADDFIGRCVDYSGNDTAKVYYSQYMELLKSLGGNSMTMNLDRAVLKEIYTDREKLDCFNIFGSLWDKRRGIFTEIISELLDENGFLGLPDDPKNTFYFGINDIFSLGFEIRYWSFGFVHAPGNPESLKGHQDELMEVLKNIKIKNIFSTPVLHDDHWVWRDVDINKIGDCKCIIDNFNTLKELLGVTG